MVNNLKYWWDVEKHRLWVAFYVLKACTALIKRAVHHDLSKFDSIERSGFEKYLPGLREVEYGSFEYYERMKVLQTSLDHHYQVNSHHPEHYPGGYHDMSPLDKVEMMCDWRAAIKKHKGSTLRSSLEINEKRFHLDKSELAAILRDISEIK